MVSATPDADHPSKSPPDFGTGADAVSAGPTGGGFRKGSQGFRAEARWNAAERQLQTVADGEM
jgi:hypothetical protein